MKEGVKYDQDKPRMDLIPPTSLYSMATVLGYGAKKYAPEDWKLVPGARRRYYAAAMRHVIAWWAGEKNDPESGLPHLWHAITNLAFLIEGEVSKLAGFIEDTTEG